MEAAGGSSGQGPGWQVEHRYRAVMEVLDGSPVSEVAVQYRVSRQAVYAWRDRYAAGGIDGLRDGSRRPRTSPSRLILRRFPTPRTGRGAVSWRGVGGEFSRHLAALAWSRAVLYGIDRTTRTFAGHPQVLGDRDEIPGNSRPGVVSDR